MFVCVFCFSPVVWGVWADCSPPPLFSQADLLAISQRMQENHRARLESAWDWQQWGLLAVQSSYRNLIRFYINVNAIHTTL